MHYLYQFITICILSILFFPQKTQAQPIEEILEILQIDTLIDSGSKDNRINWAIQNRGENNPSAEFVDKEEFLSYFESDGLLAAFTLGDEGEKPPYAQYRNFFNLYSVYWPDAQSEAEGWNFTTLHAIRDSLWLPWANDETGWITLFSTTKHGGGGGAGLERDLRVGSGKMYGMGWETLLHEFGHTMPGLLDEYSASGEWSGGQCWETPNTTGFTTLDDIPWRFWIEPETPMPTPYTGEYLNTIGAFEGAMTNFFGCHRPTARGCYMGAGGFEEGFGQQLCAPCQQRVICFLYKYVNPIEAFSPIENELEVTGTQTIQFSADVLKPEPNTQKYEWILNGKVVATGVEALEWTFGVCEDYELVFAVTDTNTLVRYDPKFQETYPKPYREVRWTINQTDIGNYGLNSIAQSTPPDCTGAANGSIHFDISGGATPYTIFKNGQAVSNPLTGLVAGNYEFDIIDANGCSVVNSVEITAAPLLNPQICSAFIDETWTLTVETPNYDLADLSVNWSTGANTPEISHLENGVYFVTLVTANGCSAEASISLNYFEDDISVQETTVPSDIGQNNGKIYLDITGGLPPYTIEWADKANRDVTDTNTDNIQASGTTWDHLPEYAFNDDLGNKWLHFVPENAWISYYVEGGAIVNTYTITSADDVPERDPKDWLFQGSNNGTDWITLDEQTDHLFNERFEKRAFLVDNSDSYSYYRFYVVENHGDGSIQLQQLEFIGTRSSDVFEKNDLFKNKTTRTNLQAGTYHYQVKDANFNAFENEVTIANTLPFFASDVAVIPDGVCGVMIESPNPAYTYFWLADQTASEILQTGTHFSPPASGNYYVVAVLTASGAMSTDLKGFAVTMPQAPEIEQATDLSLQVLDADPSLIYTWYSEPVCGDILGTGTSFLPTEAGTYYVAAQSNAVYPEPIDPTTISGLVVRMDAADLDGDGMTDQPNPPTSSTYGWTFNNGNSWAENNWFAYRSNYQNGLGIVDFATIWLQRIEEAENGYQTILMAYQENALSFPNTAPFEGLSANIPKYDNSSQLFANDTPSSTLDGQTYLNGKVVDPLTTPNPLQFCVLGTVMTEVANEEIFYNDMRWEGKIGELLLWDHALSDEEMKGVSEFLRKKWIATADLESPRTAMEWDGFPVGTSPFFQKEPSISLYPNPTPSQLTIEGLSEDFTLEIMDGNGKIFKTLAAQNAPLNFDIQHLPPGIYFVKMVSEAQGQTFVRKIVKR